MVKSIKDLDLKGKNLLIRVDFNVPIKNGVVGDDTRIRKAMPTIEYALQQGAKVALVSHLGRPKGEKNLEYSLKPVADYINEKGLFKVQFVSDCIGSEVENAINSVQGDTVLLLENVRFYKGEEKNEPDFTKELAKPFNAYVNDAFGTCHRKHASVYGVPEIISDKAAGFLVEKEVKYFSTVINNPERPLAAILGGAKVSDKIGVISSLLNIADVILIGGAMAYTFLKYNGNAVGTSLVEDDQMDTVAHILQKAKEKGVDIYLPYDHIISDKFGGVAKECGDVDIPDGYMGLDIGILSIVNYEKALSNCKTILWNGPMGVFEQEDYAKGTFSIAKKLASLDATVIVGGGDSVAAINKAGMADKISHISTGGGASLEYVEFGSLPGVDILSV